MGVFDRHTSPELSVAFLNLLRTDKHHADKIWPRRVAVIFYHQNLHALAYGEVVLPGTLPHEREMTIL